MARLVPGADGVIPVPVKTRVELAAGAPTCARALRRSRRKPMGVYPILAQRYGQQHGAAVVMLVMTVLSFFSISLVLHLVVGNPVA
ncbi:hypothetical protein [Paracoccus pantotrophus]